MTPFECGYGNHSYYYEPFNSRIIHGNKGTIVKVKQSYIDMMAGKGIKIARYYQFRFREDDGKLLFMRVVQYDNKEAIDLCYNGDKEAIESERPCEFGIHVDRLDLKDFVDVYVKDDKHEVEEIKFKFQRKDREIPGLMSAWVIFIIILIASMIFKYFYVLWFIENIIFQMIRKEIRNDDNKAF